MSKTVKATASGKGKPAAKETAPATRYPFEPAPGEIGMGPDQLREAGEIGPVEDAVPQGQALELIALVKGLKARRESMGLSLTDVSDRSGLTRQAISKLENGHALNPTLATVYRYALALDATIGLSVVEAGSEAT